MWLILAVFLFSASFVSVENNVSSMTLNKSENQTQKTSSENELSELTMKIVSLSANRKAKNSAERFQSTDDFAELAEERYEKLSELIESDPSEVLRVALPDGVLSKIPTALRAYFEKREHLHGELEVIAECDDNDGRMLYYLNTEKGRFSLHFTNQPEEELLTGARVNVKGVRVGENIAVDQNTTRSESNDFEINAPAVLPNTLGEIKVLVLLVNFQNDMRQPFTIEQSNNLIFNTASNSSVTNFYREVSYQQTWLTGNTFGWFTLPINTGDCGGRQTALYAKQAAQNAGINLSSYNKIVYVYPNMSSCGYSGFADLGGTETWINGSLNFPTITHELGHSFGLSHAKAWDCGSSVIGSNCAVIEYGNMADVMGSAGAKGHFHAYHKERLGFLNGGNTPPVTLVQSSGTYFISPLSSQDFSPKALKILKSIDSQGRKTWYYAEFRQPTGYDSFLSYVYSGSNLTKGLMITADSETNGAENFQLDLTPETASRADSALAVNQSFTDSSAGFTITTLSADSSGATVKVTFGSQPPATCVSANPSISASPTATQWIGAGSVVSYSIVVSNNNSSDCINNTFNLQNSVPVGWSAVTSAPNMGISAQTPEKYQ